MIIRDLEHLRRQYENDFKHSRDNHAYAQAFLKAFSHNDIEKVAPGKNSTAIPALAFVGDILRTFYKSILFGEEKWLEVDANHKDYIRKRDERTALRLYLQSKIRAGNTDDQLNALVDDYVDWGAAYVTPGYVVKKGRSQAPTSEGGKDYIETITYQGAVLQRIPPDSIVYDVRASTFPEAAKFWHEHVSLGDLYSAQYERGFDESKVDKIIDDRLSRRSKYFDSIELVNFCGDVFDTATKTLYNNLQITYTPSPQRERHILFQKEYYSAFGYAPVLRAAYKERGDASIPVSPLAPLAGMQNRINRLENKKADVIDLTADPILVVMGDDDGLEHNRRNSKVLKLPIGGDAKFLIPNAVALQLTPEIQQYIDLIEFLSGSPRTLAGYRTPGEKSFGEVNMLQNNAVKPFVLNAKSFERTLLQPGMREFTSIEQQYFSPVDAARILTIDGVQAVRSIGLKDLQNTVISIRGSEHFEHKLKILGSIQTLVGLGVLNPQHPAARNFSWVEFMKDLPMLLDLNNYSWFQTNVAPVEEGEFAKMVETVQRQTQEVNLIGEQEVDGGV